MTANEPVPTGSEELESLLSARLFRALADPTRLQLLCRLIVASGPRTVTQVSSCCGVHLSGVSRHLGVLREAGLVRAEREGREVRYSPETESITAALRSMADAISACGSHCETGGTECRPNPSESREGGEETT